MSETVENIEDIEYQLGTKHKRFVNMVVNGKAQDAAYIEAGFKAKNNDIARALASRMLTKENIAKYFALQSAKLQKAIETKTEVSVLKTVSELARIGYCDPVNIFDEGGNLKEIKDMDENTRRAIASVEVRTETREGVKTAEIAKIRFWNKNDALKTIATYLGILVEKHEHSGTLVVKELKDLPKDELLKLAEMQPVGERGN